MKSNNDKIEPVLKTEKPNDPERRKALIVDDETSRKTYKQYLQAALPKLIEYLRPPGIFIMSFWITICLMDWELTR